jgi:hypothetical protein
VRATRAFPRWSRAPSVLQASTAIALARCLSQPDSVRRASTASRGARCPHLRRRLALLVTSALPALLFRLHVRLAPTSQTLRRVSAFPAQPATTAKPRPQLRVLVALATTVRSPLAQPRRSLAQLAPTARVVYAPPRWTASPVTRAATVLRLASQPRLGSARRATSAPLPRRLPHQVTRPLLRATRQSTPPSAQLRLSVTAASVGQAPTALRAPQSLHPVQLGAIAQRPP